MKFFSPRIINLILLAMFAFIAYTDIVKIRKDKKFRLSIIFSIFGLLLILTAIIKGVSISELQHMIEQYFK